MKITIKGDGSGGCALVIGVIIFAVTVVTALFVALGGGALFLACLKIISS